MKKWCALFLIVSFMLFFYKKPEEAKPVFEEIDSNYMIETIDLSSTSFTTRSIIPFLDSVTLSKVIYEIPKVYSTKFKSPYFEYTFQNKSNEKGLLEIEKMVQKKLTDMGGGSYAQKISFSGVLLKSIEVYGSASKIETLKEKIKNY